MNTDQISALRKFASLLTHDAMETLWPENIIQGEQYLRFAKGRAVFMDDIGRVFLEFQKVGILEPIKFCPSHSGAAFLGLECSYETKSYPHAGDAAHWNWRVLGPTEWGQEWYKLVDSGQERKYQYTYDPKKWPVWLDKQAGEEFRKNVVVPKPLTVEELRQLKLDQIKSMSRTDLLAKLFE